MPEASPAESAGGTPDDSGLPKVLEFRHPDGDAMKLNQLPMGVLADIATAHGIAIWATLVDGPLGFLPARALEDLYRACCRELKASAPKKLTAGAVLRAFHLVDDDEPDVWVDGRPREGSPSTT